MDPSAIARRQFGVLSREQALAAGMTAAQVRWRVEKGFWQSLHRGVYLTSSGVVTWSARAQAALLWAGPGSVLTLWTAAHLWRLLPEAPEVLTVGIPERRTPCSTTGVKVGRRARLTSIVLDGLPVTRAAQTVIDVADLPEVSLDDAVALAARACQRGRVTASALSAELRARGRHRQRWELGLALGEIVGGAESLPEVWFVTRVQRPHALPEFSRQVVEPGGTRTDLKNSRYGINLEIDGQVWHAGERFHDDRRRDRRAAGRGELTLRATFLDLARNPCQLAAEIGAALLRRGWPGPLRRCSTCRSARQGDGVWLA